MIDIVLHLVMTFFAITSLFLIFILNAMADRLKEKEKELATAKNKYDELRRRYNKILSEDWVTESTVVYSEPTVKSRRSKKKKTRKTKR